MTKSTDILAQIQQIRNNRKNPKSPTQLKRIHINASQKNGISVAQQCSAIPIALKKTNKLSSFSLTFSIGLHVILAILIGAFCIKEQMVYKNDVLKLEFIVLEPKISHPPHPHHLPYDIFSTLPYLQVVQIQREPVGTSIDIPQIQDTFVLLDEDVSTLNNIQQSFEIIQNAAIPPQQSNLKLRSVLIIDKPTTRKSSIDKLTQTKSNEEYSLPNQPNVYTETIPMQTTPIINPNYPKIARLAKKEGKVILQATIDIDGIPKNITATTDLGYGLEDAAIVAFKKSRYIPAKKNGIPIASSVEIEFEFRIQE